MNNFKINTPPPPVAQDKIKIILLIAAIALINLLFVFTHECWRDEAQAWLIARDNNLSSLLNVTSYEGHPVLWFLILMPFAKLGLPYFTLKLISYFIILLALFIIAFKSPFNLVAKFLFIFNPAFIYCYVTPARSYCLCALFIIMLAWLYRTREEQPILYGVILALTLQTHVIMAGFVFCLCVERALSFLKFKNFKKFIGLCLPFASALFLLFEFRNSSSVITNHKISFIKFFIEGAANSFRLLNLMALSPSPCLLRFPAGLGECFALPRSALTSPER